MTDLRELTDLIHTTDWFSCLGQEYHGKGLQVVQLPNLDQWSRVTDILPDDRVPDLIAGGMEWLPSQRDMVDPIHRDFLEQRAVELGKRAEFGERSSEIYKVALAALRGFQGDPFLKVGPHDFAEAARGSALFAVRRAAFEILLGIPGFWCRLMHVYADGHWPLGVMPTGDVVVL